MKDATIIHAGRQLCGEHALGMVAELPDHVTIAAASAPAGSERS